RVRVLFGVDLDVDEGELIALLGTNGAGKSTLLKAISGVAIADRGAVVFDGVDITHAPPNEIAPRGVAMIPGGQGTFGSLTVEENLRAAGWMLRRDRAERRAAVEEVLDLFPVLRRRLGDPAADLSGGQQQMLGRWDWRPPWSSNSSMSFVICAIAAPRSSSSSNRSTWL